ELRIIIDKAVISGQSKYAKGISHYLRISKIPSQFDSAFEGVYSLFDMGAIKTDKEQPFVNETSIQELTWKDPLASQIFRDNTPIIDDL
ncbi:8335_t:CDS:2, partial [Scutellospora calospora]